MCVCNKTYYIYIYIYTYTYIYTHTYTYTYTYIYIYTDTHTCVCILSKPVGLMPDLLSAVGTLVSSSLLFSFLFFLEVYIIYYLSYQNNNLDFYVFTTFKDLKIMCMQIYNNGHSSYYNFSHSVLHAWTYLNCACPCSLERSFFKSIIFFSHFFILPFLSL